METIARIYKGLITEGKTNVIVPAPLTPHPIYSDSLAPLFKNTDAKDITKHFSFEVA